MPNISLDQQSDQSANHDDESRLDKTAFRGMDLWRVLGEQTTRYADKEALVFGDEHLTFRKLTERSEHCAAGLYQLGLRQGDKLAVVLPNWTEFVVAFLATAKLGVVLVPLNVRYRSSEMAFVLRDIGAKILVTCASYSRYNYLSLWREVRPSLPALEHIIVVGQPIDNLEFRAWDEVLSEGAQTVHLVPPIKPNPGQDVAALVYTSGSTGIPKGVMLSHSNLLYTATSNVQILQATATDRMIAPVPMFYIFGLVSYLTALCAGSSLALLDIFSPEAALALIERERISILIGVPTMYILELHHPDLNKYDLSSLRTGILAAAPTSFELIRKIRTQLNCNVLSAYGMTETATTLTSTSFSDDTIIRARTVGRALPEVAIKIVDDNNEAVAFGQTGELVCRSPGLMLGYYNRPEATNIAIDSEGWFYTGDLASLAEDGLVKIMGRKKDIINRGGFKIFPRELEELYYRNPKVQEVAIIGIPDAQLGELSCACIQLRPRQTATEIEMRDYIAALVPDYKVPDVIHFVNQFPLTASGKIKKMQLRQEVGKNYNL